MGDHIPVQRIFVRKFLPYSEVKAEEIKMKKSEIIFL